MTLRHRTSVALLALAVVGGALLVAPRPVAAVSDAPATKVPQTPILSARRFPGSLQGAADATLVASLDAHVARSIGDECVIVQQDGRTIYAHDTTRVLAPASVMKLATATALLEILGHDRTLDTVVTGPKPGKDGTVHGDLYVIGGGDPILTTKGYIAVFDDADQVVVDLGTVVDRITDAGVKRIDGSLIGDDSRYDRSRELPGWPTRFVQGGTVAPLSALVVNDGSTGYVEAPDVPNPNRRAGDPALLFVQTLTTMLRARGIEVTGQAATGVAPNDVEELARSASLPMADLVAEMLTYSDNTTAELLVREVGVVTSGRGTTEAGLTAIRSTLASMGFDLTNFDQRDGSGLDASNRIDCPLALALLEHLDRDPSIGPRLAVAGRSGTLKRRMLASASTGKVRAKTGTLTGVNALAGYADTTTGNHLTFVMLHNGNDPRTTGVGDSFADRLMSYGSGTKVSALSPLAAK